MNYLFHVFEKLGVSNRFELAILAVQGMQRSNHVSGWGARAIESSHPLKSKPLKKVRGAPLIVALAHLGAYCIEKNGLSAKLLVPFGGSEFLRTRALQPCPGRAPPEHRENGRNRGRGTERSNRGKKQQALYQ